MASTIAWLDQSDEHRRQMREAIGLFRDEGSVDELGLGRIRDAFSDRLFPGTSVLWRRARYLLFVPWVYLRLEQGQGGRGPAEERARRIQRQLAGALNQHGSPGVIGASGADVKQTPDMILWAALRGWGIRTEPGRLPQVRAEAVAQSRRRGQLEDEQREHNGWHPRVAALMPEAFPKEATFALESGEARFLSDRILELEALPGTTAARRADSLLAVFLREPPQAGLELPWRHPVKAASVGLADAVRHAGCFSDLVHGARLLYADLVAMVRGDDELKAAVDDAFGNWSVTVQPGRLEELREWFSEIDGFWRLMHELNPRIERGERDFVNSWARLALVDPGAVRRSERARKLILEREHQAKGGVKARLAREGSIGRDAPAVCPTQFSFRCSQGVSIAADIAAAAEA